MARALALLFRSCMNCWITFSTYDKHDNYCDNCSYMESTQEWMDRVDAQIEELIIT